MRRLYKFLLLLFTVLYALSTVYIVIICYAGLYLTRSMAEKGIRIGTVRFVDMLVIGLYYGFSYAVVQILVITLLLNKSFRRKQKFTLKNMIAVSSWFFIVTTIIHIIYGFYIYSSGPWIIYLFQLDPLMQFGYFFWLPFPLAWLTLYIIFASRIPKTE